MSESLQNNPVLKKLGLEDLTVLVNLENTCFETDRLSRRNFRYLLSRANAETWGIFLKNEILGYTMLLFHSGTSLARLYSIAIHPKHSGKGFGKLLLQKSEEIAFNRECAYLRLEVRSDNSRAIDIYLKSGFRKIGTIPDYYEDGEEAIRYEKSIYPEDLKPDLQKVPYYSQTLDFTCGPATLLMAMRALDSTINMNRIEEIKIWREATTIFMTSGHGGCGPFGLALAAFKRGFIPEIYVNEKRLFLDSVRNPEKKEVMRLVQEEFLNEIMSLKLPLSYVIPGLEEIEEKFDNGVIPIILISSYRLYKEKFPHWIVVTGFDEKFIYVHDPYIDIDKNKSSTDCINMPILRKEFELMAKYGKSAQKAILLIKRKE